MEQIFIPLTICVLLVILKFMLWSGSNMVHSISVKQSFMCWFTQEDFSNPLYKDNKFLLFFSNLANVLFAIILLTIIAAIAVVGLGLLSKV